MDMSQYRDLFVSEAREHVHRLADLVPVFETAPEDQATIAALFRSAHSVKGMAASMSFSCIAELAHRLEDLLDGVRRGQPVAAGLGQLLLAGADALEGMIAAVAAGAADGEPLPDLLAQIADYAGTGPVPPVTPPTVAAAPSSPEPPPSPAGDEAGEASQTVRVRTGILDHLINITGELVTVKHRLLSLAGESTEPRLGETVGDLAKLVRQLHDQVMTARLIPFSTTADRFPRTVRDVARKSGKQVAFAVTGKELELDRGILEGLAEPLLHLLRNAVDHGIEPPAERQAAGKPAVGTITLSARREKDQLVVTVADDGRGMAPDDIRAAAVARKVVTVERAALLSPQEALLLVCESGFSTAGAVTDVSGRGVGMDVVKTTVQALNGTLAIESEPGLGCRFVLKLPLTIAIINVLLMEAGGLPVAVPVTSVQRTLQLERQLLVSQGGATVFFVDEEPLTLLSLSRLLGRPLVPAAGSHLPVFVCELRGRRVGLAVDRLIGQREVFVKPLGRPLAAVKGISGGAVLGDGEIVFILDLPGLQ
jgi:two-component system chemotaxis sensor kinase CheA